MDVGIFERRCQGDTSPVVRAATCWSVHARSDSAFAWLDQIQLCCPFDGRPAIHDVKFAIDALGMGADRAHGNHELIGDLRPGKLGFEQAEHVKLTLAEPLRSGEVG